MVAGTGPHESDRSGRSTDRVGAGRGDGEGGAGRRDGESTAGRGDGEDCLGPPADHAGPASEGTDSAARAAGPRRAAFGTALSRRGVLAGLAGVGAFAGPTVGDPTTPSEHGTDPTLHVRVYPGPTPLHARLRQRSGYADGWTDAHREAAEAVEDALDQISRYAATETSLGRVDYAVERCAPLGRRALGGVSSSGAVVDLHGFFDAFRDRVRDRERGTDACSHLLLWWGAADYTIGYGGVHPDSPHVAANPDGGAHAVANVGATETWDTRSVSRNIAIHEAVHTLLTGDVVAAVGETGCDHDLGTVVETTPGTREVSPMATSYAGPERAAGTSGSGTQWHGTGCYDHDAFARHDGTDDVGEWTYTTQLSDATLDAVTRYVERYLVG